jgi:hypothetical protein
MINLTIAGIIILAVSLILLLWNIRKAPILSDDEEDLLEDIARQQEARWKSQRRLKSTLSWLYDRNKGGGA